MSIGELIIRLRISRWKATHECPYCGEESIHLTGTSGGGYYNDWNRYVETSRKLTFQCMSCSNSWKKKLQPRGRGIPYEEDEQYKSQLEHDITMREG